MALQLYLGLLNATIKGKISLMRTIGIIFLLALTAVTFEVYSDWAMMRGNVTAPVDPIARAVSDSVH
ncbi:hypothetical protein [Bradyrhizobium sp. S69]|uniref:hypothetical protein n=1 Tax=Bradyrhizobium sp. S69 TaxID=1641856 RepID=UPI00131BADE9|nr:hypothetical protein [Bradyrhizobium sp. S69]